MKNHVFRGTLFKQCCQDCGCERSYLAEASVWIYRAPGATEWTPTKPDCEREIPRDVEVGVAAVRA